MITQLKKYGPVNSIVLSRASGADNVYLQDEDSIAENGLCEIKITDNQIMNWNDRSDYLPGILGRLNGLEYYLNDYSSTGIFYYNVCDKYYASIDDNSYPCIMFNDEINITQGAEENIYTDMPEETETDYTKSDKTDRKINQTYLIVDKQNQTIQSVVNTVTEQNNKISQVTQTVDELNSKISDIADITISGESSYATFDLDNINQSEPIMIKIRPTTENISYLYPSTNLYPSSIQYLKTRTLRFYNKTTGENIDYILPDDLLIYNSQVYDEFYLDYDSQTCQVTKRCGYNADGSVYTLATEQVVSYSYPQIVLTDGDYTISLQGYQNGYLFTRLMAQNIYTSQFATRAEVSSSISQTAQEINLEVSKKVGKDEVVSAINQSAEQITLKSNRLVVESDGFTLDGEGNMAATSGEIGGFILNDISFTGNINGLYNYNDFDRMLCMSSIVGNSNLDNTNINILDATEDGRVDTADLSKINRIVNGTIENTKYIQGTVEINSNNPKNCLSIKDNNGQYAVQIGLGGINSQEILARNLICGDEGNLSGADPTYVIINGPDGKAYFKGASTGNIRQTLIEKNSIVTNDLTVYGTFNNSSDKKLKENIINLDNSCSKIVKELTPISYTFKKDKNKKTHYGFIAQDVEKIFKENNMQPPTEIKDGTYTLDYLNLIAILWKDNQKLHEEIDKLKEMIKNA